jgi:hypothetical protein
MPIAEATERTTEQDAARARLTAMALDEFQRVVVAIAVDGALGRPAPPLALRLGTRPGHLPEREMCLVIHGDLTGLQLHELQALIGQNLDLEHAGGELRVICPSLR